MSGGRLKEKEKKQKTKKSERRKSSLEDLERNKKNKRGINLNKKKGRGCKEKEIKNKREGNEIRDKDRIEETIETRRSCQKKERKRSTKILYNP